MAGVSLLTILILVFNQVTQAPTNHYGLAQPASPAPSPTPPIAVFEAEDGTLSNPFVVGSSPPNTYIYQPNPNPAIDPTAGGSAQYTFTVPSPNGTAAPAGEQFIIQAVVDVQSPDATSAVYVNVDSEPTDSTMLWDIPATSGFETRTVSWRNNGVADANKYAPKVFSLMPGTHTLIIRGQQGNVKIDKIIVEEYACLADVSQDGIVNAVDFNLIQSKFGTCDGVYDLNGDGCVTILDFGIVHATFAGVCRANIQAAISPTNTPTPTVSPVPTSAPTNTSITMTATFQGITKTRPYPENFCQNVLVTIAGGNLSQPITQTVCFTPSTINSDWFGTANIDLPANPTLAPYSIYLKGPRHLQKRICDAIPTETTGGLYHCTRDSLPLVIGANTLDFTGILLLAGDLPVTNDQQNGVIDSEDTAYIRLHFGNTDSTILQKADLNLDGSIDTQDFSLVIAALSIKYDDLAIAQ